jgi:hypothetical protein
VKFSRRPLAIGRWCLFFALLAAAGVACAAIGKIARIPLLEKIGLATLAPILASAACLVFIIVPIFLLLDWRKRRRK